MDSKGNLYISYRDAEDNILKIDTNRSGDWATIAVDFDGNVGGFNDMVIDTSDTIHILYSDYTNGQLKHASASFE